MSEQSPPLQPILVMMSWRGGERLQRCLDSIAPARHHFKRAILSITAAEDSEDMQRAAAFAEANPGVEVICTSVELPTMKHQAFWVTYLERTGVTRDDWIYWLAYDDQVRTSGINELVDPAGNWPLEKGTCYFGPWAMRHEQADKLYNGPWDEPLESWTSFPLDGPLKLPVPTWIADQLRQPTYMQMSGSVCRFESYLRIRDARPRKKGPMRIEMATVATPCNEFVSEFATPVSIIYGRPNSDRVNYGATARKEDIHLLLHLGRRLLLRPKSALPTTIILSEAVVASKLGSPDATARHDEAWVSRGTVGP